MLALNNQTKTGVKKDLIEKIADGIVLGVNFYGFLIFIFCSWKWKKMKN